MTKRGIYAVMALIQAGLVTVLTKMMLEDYGLFWLNLAGVVINALGVAANVFQLLFRR